MAAVGFVLLVTGAMLIYAGMTGDSLPGAVRDVVQGNGAAGSANAAGEAGRDAAQTRRPAQP